MGKNGIDGIVHKLYWESLRDQLLQCFILPSTPMISTDASDYGLDAVMSQMGPDDAEKTVTFASRILSTAKRKYAVVEKEALACV